ncbi:transcription/translation regulatory transformer protein RfaH [Laribacter hongkongensis]|uniref:transcription/translation regulatory transformer protein RfaH n=1 Tax=Laribacter hongkongensis TaxID=168471 RepID=UPI0023D9226D|nr:transcription/translation regulatory transformer protein RfaH [Laribacter hongkongensis]
MSTLKTVSEEKMHWYLVHTKPRQEQCALQNLQQQGYQCYLPMLATEKLRQGRLVVSEEALFPRYLFIRLGLGQSDKSWAPIRSTRGVNQLVRFGTEPARIDDELIERLRGHEVARAHPEPLFRTGERVRLTDGPFAGIEGIYQMTDGESRVIVLIEFLTKPVVARVASGSLRKVV